MLVIKILIIVFLLLNIGIIVFGIDDEIGKLKDENRSKIDRGMIYTQILCLPLVLIVFLIIIGILIYYEKNLYPWSVYYSLIAITLGALVSIIKKIKNINSNF